MGDDEAAPNRELFVDAFYIDRVEMTTARYAKFLRAIGSVNAPEGWSDRSGRGRVDARRRRELERSGCLLPLGGKRLPTETEWRKPRAGVTSDDSLGRRSPTLDRANYENRSPEAYDGGLSAVGSFPAGKSPLASTISPAMPQWVADWYQEGIDPAAVRNPSGPATGEKRIVRGGGRFDPGYRLTPVKRWNAVRATRGEDIGFRCARDAT